MPARKKISSRQMELLLEFAESHQEISLGRFPAGPLGNQAARREWDSIAVQLNSVAEGATKTADQWRRYWIEFKAKTKTKAADCRRYASRTGGGPNKLVPLNSFEERILALIGPVAVEGLPSVRLPINNKSLIKIQSKAVSKMFTTNTVQAGTVPTLQYQEHAQKSQGKNIENVQQKSTQQTQQQQEFPTFCYTTNVNMIGKIGAGAATGGGGVAGSVNIAQLTTSDDKTCYIAQPFSYNYALVNQMQIASNGIQNTISNISFKCDVCGLMFGHLSLLNAHKRIHAQDAESNITVVAAGVTSANEVAMPPHIQILSSDPTEQQQQQQQHHVQIQDTKPVIIDKTVKCITCGGPISNNPKRKGPKLIRCENCIAQDSVDQRNNQLNATQIFVATEDNVKFEVGGVSGVQNSSDPLSSAQANQQTQQPQQTKPLPGHHPVKKRNLASVTKCQNCNGSGIIFVGNKNKNNQTNAEKPFHCNICGGSFSRYSSLWSHKKLHSGEKNFKCGICGIAFAKAVYLKNHSRIHTGEKPYRCSTCGMQFSQSPHLKNHERTHSGEKPYVCEVCDKGFARHATLWNHRRIHTGEKPYKCDTCGSAFSQAAHLKNHTKVHSGEKPFKCDICSAAFADRFALKRHRGIHDKYGQTAPLPNRVQQNQQEQQNSQQQPSEQQNTQATVEVEHRTEQTL